MDTTILEVQLNTIIEKYSDLRNHSKYDDLSDLPEHERQALVTRAISAIHRISGSGSTYSQEIERVLKNAPELHSHTSSIIGIIQALKDDLNAGYIQSITEIIHSEIFADFLEMAKYLCDKGYKDSAAVIAGSTLESHIRKLAIKNSIPLQTSVGFTKAETLNQELVKTHTYSILDQKNITAWLDLRNKAAHGNYIDYNIDQVKLFISSIQDFITRIPA